MNNLFEKFPVINYANNISINLLTKVRFNDSAFNNSSLFYPYTIKEAERPEHVALNYYDDARYVWIVYLCNKTVDPYYEWPLDSLSFDQFITNKYSSTANAMSTTAFYRVSYKDDDRMLSPSQHSDISQYPAAVKKYWRPEVNEQGSTLYFVRKELDWAVETNKVINLEVNNSRSFVIGERVVQSNTSGTSAKGIVKAVSDSFIVINNIEGQFFNTNSTITAINGITSKTGSNVSNVYYIANTISDVEASYWEPVSFYTYEDEVNNSRKFIRLIDKAYVDTVEKEIADSLK
jgi:hypothetical protein